MDWYDGVWLGGIFLTFSGCIEKRFALIACGVGIQWMSIGARALFT